MNLQKAVATIGAAAVGLGILLGVDVSPAVEVVAAAVLTITPIAVYVVQNDNLTPTLANKAIVALGPAVVGVALLFGVDVTKDVENVTAAALTVTPLLVFFVSNDQLS